MLHSDAVVDGSDRADTPPAVSPAGVRKIPVRFLHLWYGAVVLRGVCVCVSLICASHHATVLGGV